MLRFRFIVSQYVLSIANVAICSTKNSPKLLSPEALLLAQNAPQAVWWPGSTRTRWRSSNHSPDSQAGLRGPQKGRGEWMKGDDVGEEWQGGRYKGVGKSGGK